jgi:hypothetical protein
LKTTLLKLAQIITTAGTQIRARIDGETVDQYAEAMQDAANKFPTVVVFHDGSQYILADGFHRVMAATRNGFLDIEADVRKGTKSDALKFALSANTSHGLRRSNLDKRRSVELALAEWPKLSDRELARICAVSDHFVGDVRPVSTAIRSQLPSTRTGADGKERRMPAHGKATSSAPETEREEERPHVVSGPTPEPEPAKPRAKDSEFTAAIGGSKAMRLICQFDNWLEFYVPDKSERKWALNLLADHIEDLKGAQV